MAVYSQFHHFSSQWKSVVAKTFHSGRKLFFICSDGKFRNITLGWGKRSFLIVYPMFTPKRKKPLQILDLQWF